VSKPYDATSKDLIEADPAGWVTFLGCPVSPAQVRLVDADVSTVTADADKVILVESPSPWLLHLEIQARWHAGLDRRLLRDNGLLQYRHSLPVASVVVILNSESNMSSLTGSLEMRPPIGRAWTFAYEVIRVWERPASDFLAGPLGLLPLAPLANVRVMDLPSVVDAMKARIQRENDHPLAAKLWAATYVMMGLRYDEPVIDMLLSGVKDMEDSVTYQALVRRGLQQGLQQGLQEGALSEAKRMLIVAGQPKLGRPSPSVDAAVAAITDPARLESLVARIYSASSWDELLTSN